MPVILVAGRQNQDFHKFKTSLLYIVSSKANQEYTAAPRLKKNSRKIKGFTNILSFKLEKNGHYLVFINSDLSMNRLWLFYFAIQSEVSGKTGCLVKMESFLSLLYFL